MNKATFVVAPEFLCALAVLLREGGLLGAGGREPFISIADDPIESDIDLFMEDYIRGWTEYISQAGGCAGLAAAWGWSATDIEQFSWEWVFDGTQS